MELSEVVNPHFAFPVVGVVLCAVLVFAFGFKSPVQPPSFDSFDEDRKPRKSKHKKKSASSDHVENHVSDKAAVNKTAANTRSAAAGKAADKSPQQQKEAKPKAKKAVKPAPTPVPVAEIEAKKAVDEGGWETVSVSKKKKNKPRKEVVEQIQEKGEENWENEITASIKETPRVESSKLKVEALKPKVALTVYNEPATEAPKAELEVPQPQRAKKEKTKEIEVVAAIDQSDKENTPEPEVKESSNIIAEVSQPLAKKEPKKAKKSKVAEPPDIVYAQAAAEATAVVEKKSKNKKAASKKEVTLQKEAKSQKGASPEKEALPEKEASPQKEASPPKETSSQKKASPPKEAAVSVSSSAQQTSKSNSSNTEPKAVKSQKNKKDKHKKEASPVQESPGASLAETKSSPSGSTPQSTSSIQAVPEPVVEAAANQTNGATSTVSFDELGDWQEAKPAKKQKKKARRDN